MTNMRCVYRFPKHLNMSWTQIWPGGKGNSQADNEWTGSKCGIWGQGNTAERRRDDLEGA